MTKKILTLFSILLFTLTSCSSRKKIATTLTTQQKIEIQYQKYKGIPYKFGGTNSRGFDCSGFIQTVFLNAFNYQLPRTTGQLSKFGKKTNKKNLIPGDLVFFKPNKKYKHVGIYVGNNQFIHSSTSKGVIKSSLNNVYWKDKYRAARRVLK